MQALPIKKEVEEVLANWGRWCRGGWPPLLFSSPPTSRDYIPTDSRDKRPPPVAADAVSGEAANIAIANLALDGDTRSYQIIAAWWAHGRPAREIAKDMHCSLASVYNYRLIAMANFWPKYVDVVAQNQKREKINLTA